MMRMKINKNKSIGKVIYVVEGEKTEVEILKHIFSELLPYTVIETQRDGTNIIHFKNDTSKNNQIYVIVSKRPQIVGLERDGKYFEEIYNRLNYDFRLNPDESALYYLFDRDRDSNSKDVTKKLLKKLCNSRENQTYEMNGALLLSYPCIEAFLFNSFENISYHSNGKQIKQEAKQNKYFINTLTLDDLLYATKTMLNLIKKIRGYNLKIEELDNLRRLNISIFNAEEKLFLKKTEYITLSLIGISLLDLGVIELY